MNVNVLVGMSMMCISYTHALIDPILSLPSTVLAKSAYVTDSQFKGECFREFCWRVRFKLGADIPGLPAIHHWPSEATTYKYHILYRWSVMNKDHI
jgi:hypothetical protein